ncbi:MAG TPA: hypothetical protein VJN42_01845 [Candidatus Acidoferrum sp.]|nr:hypothetical protein [Candidatus Acidoferrum sp.]
MSPTAMIGFGNLVPVQAEQIKLNNKLSAFKYYPVTALGFGYHL